MRSSLPMAIEPSVFLLAPTASIVFMRSDGNSWYGVSGFIYLTRRSHNQSSEYLPQSSVSAEVVGQLLGKRNSTVWNDDQGSAGRHLSFLLVAPSTDAVILGAQILILGVRGLKAIFIIGAKAAKEKPIRKLALLMPWR